MKKRNHFIAFKQEVSHIPLPEKFTFPFYYEPHTLSSVAAKELQEYLETQSDWQHNFGLQTGQKGLVIGKMFGVLVVKNPQGELGYLSAFSGKLANTNDHHHFVPPVFDMLQQDGFFKKEEKILNQYNKKIETLENDPEFLMAQKTWLATLQAAEKDKEEKKQASKVHKIYRDALRQEAEKAGDFEAYKTLQKKLSQQSREESIQLKMMQRYWRETLSTAHKKVLLFQSKIDQLKSTRKQKSAQLQQKLFHQYAFLNQKGISKSLGAIFDENPPASAGECAAPKLLHYAFLNQLQPIAMAEFWWGQSPKSEIRKHGQFYPACTGKCQPILAHMLEGIPMDPNPLLNNTAEEKTIEVVYDDPYLCVINKPTEFLSVPGKTTTDSVLERLKKKFPDATGPLVVHRLDMATSGLLLVAKTTDIYVQLQAQFIKRTIKKRYVALLEGKLSLTSGQIELPLRVDLENRPNQLVCYTYGKPALTKWEVVEYRNNHTLVHFYPITGRTHQLRVHAAHVEGLNSPIVGDDLYGKKADRLHLHADQLRFVHPIYKKEITLESKEGF